MYGVEYRNLLRICPSIYIQRSFDTFMCACVYECLFFALVCSAFPEIFVCVCAIMNENAIEHVKT